MEGNVILRKYYGNISFFFKYNIGERIQTTYLLVVNINYMSIELYSLWRQNKYLYESLGTNTCSVVSHPHTFV